MCLDVMEFLADGFMLRLLAMIVCIHSLTTSSDEETIAPNTALKAMNYGQTDLAIEIHF